MHNQFQRSDPRRQPTQPVERPSLRLDGAVLRERLNTNRAAAPVAPPAPLPGTHPQSAPAWQPAAPPVPALSRPQTIAPAPVSTKQRRKRPLFFVTGAALLLLIVLSAALWWVRAGDPSKALNPAIRNQLTFAVFYPGRGSGVNVDNTSQDFDSSTGVFRFEATFGSAQLKVNEQAEPKQLKSGSAYSDLLMGLHPYGSVTSPYGSMALTHPAELGGSPALVANQQGILMFIKADHDLTKDQWQQLAGHLRLVVPRPASSS